MRINEALQRLESSIVRALQEAPHPSFERAPGPLSWMVGEFVDMGFEDMARHLKWDTVDYNRHFLAFSRQGVGARFGGRMYLLRFDGIKPISKEPEIVLPDSWPRYVVVDNPEPVGAKWMGDLVKDTSRPPGWRQLQKVPGWGYKASGVKFNP